MFLFRKTFNRRFGYLCVKVKILIVLKNYLDSQDKIKEVAKLAEGVREEARAEGKNEATIDHAMKMKQENLPVDLISRITGLNSEQIARL